MSAVPRSEAVRFGPFQFDSETLELRRNGTLVHLQERPARVLALLLQAPGQLVLRDTIQTELWAPALVGEVDIHLNVAIKKVRDALADSSKNPRFIETVPGRGYRFIHPISRDSLALLPKKGWGFSLTLTVALILAAFLLALAHLTLREEARPAHVGQKIRPLTTTEATEFDASFSPDGKRIVYASALSSGRNSSLQTIDLETLETSGLTEDFRRDRSPAWSPDGKWIAFLRFSPEDCAIHLLDTDSQMVMDEIELNDCSIRSPPWDSDSLSWSPDGTQLAFSDFAVDETQRSLFLFATGDRSVQRISHPSVGSNGDYFPRFSPDGRTLAFLRGEDHGAQEDIFLLELDSRAEKQLTTDNVTIVGLDWDPTSGEIAFSSTRSGSIPSMWKVDSKGGEPYLFSGIGPGAILPRFSRVNGSLCYVTWIDDSDIWRIPLSEEGFGDGTPLKTIDSTQHDSSAVELANSGQLVFTSHRSGKGRIWTSAQGASSGHLLTNESSASEEGSPASSPDGTRIAFDSRIDGNTDIYLMRLTDRHVTRLTDDPAPDVLPSWSADGSWIYFSSSRQGENRIWKVPVEGGEPLPVTRSASFCAQESPDGEYLYYSRSNPRRICRAPLANLDEEETLIDGIRWGRWTVGRKGIYFLSLEQEGSKRLNLYDLSTSRIHLITSLPREISHFAGNRSVSISDDQRRLYFSGGRLVVDLMLAEKQPF